MLLNTTLCPFVGFFFAEPIKMCCISLSQLIVLGLNVMCEQTSACEFLSDHKNISKKMVISEEVVPANLVVSHNKRIELLCVERS